MRQSRSWSSPPSKNRKKYELNVYSEDKTLAEGTVSLRQEVMESPWLQCKHNSSGPENMGEFSESRVFDKDTNLDKMVGVADRIAEIQYPPNDVAVAQR